MFGSRRSFFSANFLITLSILLPSWSLCLISCDKICGCRILPCHFIHCYSQELFPSLFRGCFLVKCAVILLYLNIGKFLSVPFELYFLDTNKKKYRIATCTNSMKIAVFFHPAAPWLALVPIVIIGINVRVGFEFLEFSVFYLVLIIFLGFFIIAESLFYFVPMNKSNDFLEKINIVMV